MHTTPSPSPKRIKSVCARTRQLYAATAPSQSSASRRHRKRHSRTPLFRSLRHWRVGTSCPSRRTRWGRAWRCTSRLPSWPYASAACPGCRTPESRWSLCLAQTVGWPSSSWWEIDCGGWRSTSHKPLQKANISVYNWDAVSISLSFGCSMQGPLYWMIICI